MRHTGEHDRGLPATRCWLSATLLVASLLAPTAAAAQAVVLDFDVQLPRDFGYLLGDRFTHRIVLELADPHRLDAGSLPAARRLDRWLTQETPRVVESDGWGSRRYEILLGYRLIGAPGTVTRATTPALTLDIEGPGAALALAVPAWSYSISPLLAPEARVEGVAQSLRPAREPPPVDTRARWWRIGVLGAASALVLAYLAWLHLHMAWLRAADGPFARAARDLRRLGRDAASAPGQRLALARVHRAFDETAGRTLFESDLAEFLRQQPRFAPLRDAIGAFYAASRRVFFVPGGEQPRPGVDVGSLRRLCLACRDAERGVS